MSLDPNSKVSNSNNQKNEEFPFKLMKEGIEDPQKIAYNKTNVRVVCFR
jgi:hypothetical protein